MTTWKDPWSSWKDWTTHGRYTTWQEWSVQAWKERRACAIDKLVAVLAGAATGSSMAAPRTPANFWFSYTAFAFLVVTATVLVIVTMRGLKQAIHNLAERRKLNEMIRLAEGKNQ